VAGVTGLGHKETVLLTGGCGVGGPYGVVKVTRNTVTGQSYVVPSAVAPIAGEHSVRADQGKSNVAVGKARGGKGADVVAGPALFAQ
tara:strand:+ start:6005 stop:6265 length:261 start_codon:yes stop_codon:yes gene_type:complete